MIYTSSEPALPAPAQDIVSFSFDKQREYDQDAALLIDADHPSHFLTARTYRALIKQLIAAYLALGLQPGDCVLTHLPNSYYYPAIFFSIVGAGGIWCGSNPANQVFEVNHFVQLAKPRFIITEPAYLSTVLEVWDKCQFPRHRIIVLDPKNFPVGAPTSPSTDLNGQEEICAGTRSFNDLLNHGSRDWIMFTDPSQPKTTPAVYFPTSGTTGLPKLAAISHHNLIVHHLALHEHFPFETRRLISLPFFHLFATMLTFIQPVRYFQPTFIMKRFHLHNWLNNVDKHKITELYGAPPMITATIQASKSRSNVKTLLESVRYMGVGGAPISAENINAMRELLNPDATMTNIWGMTETGIATLFRYGDNDESGAVGKLVGGYEGKLVDPEGTEVEREGEKGELYVRTQGRMLGYVGHDKETEDWWATGDVCEVRDGKVYIVGRAKELIKVRGWQVAPAEVEAILSQHPDIIDAAVVGVLAADGSSEVPRAYVVRRQRRRTDPEDVNAPDGEDLTANEVYQFSRERLASYKALDGGVCFVDTIPRTPSGKIQRRKLTELHEYNGEVVKQVLNQSRRFKDKPRADAVPGALQKPDSISISSTDGRALRRSPRLRGSGHENNIQSSALQAGQVLHQSRARPGQKRRSSTFRIHKRKTPASRAMVKTC